MNWVKVIKAMRECADEAEALAKDRQRYEYMKQVAGTLYRMADSLEKGLEDGDGSG